MSTRPQDSFDLYRTSITNSASTDAVRLARQLRCELALERCSRILLKSHRDGDPEQHETLSQALHALLQGVDVTRLYLFRNYEHPERGFCSQMLAEAIAPNATSNLGDARGQALPWSRWPQSIFDELSAGNPVGGPIAEIFASTPTMLHALSGLGIAAAYYFSIFVNEQWWGFIGYDSGEIERRWDEDELRLLYIAAEMIGASLEQWQSDQSLVASHQQLARQFEYEAALKQVSQLLIKPTYSDAERLTLLNEAMSCLLAPARVGRVYLFQNFDDPELGPSLGMYAEVCAPNILPDINAPGVQRIAWSDSPAYHRYELAAGRPIHGPTAELYADLPDVIELLHRRQIISVYFSPIFVNQQWWGYIGFDDCVLPRKWSDEEGNLLSVAADMIGSTLERWRAEDALRLAIHEQKRQLRYEIALEKFSGVLLTPSNDECALQNVFTVAIQHLLEATQSTRVYIARNFDDPQLGPCTSFFAEADADGVIPAAVHPSLKKLPMYLSSPRVIASLSAGQTVGGTIEQVYGDSPAYLSVARSLNVQAICIFPIFVSNHWWGTIGYTEANADRFWEADELRLLTVAADMIGATLERWQAQEQLRTTNERLEQQVSARTSELRATVASLNEENAERRRTEAHLATSRQQLRRLAARQEAVREEERTRISREIHDDLGQSLTALKMDVAWLNRHLLDAVSPIQQKLAAMSNLISDTIKTVQRVARDLRPGLLDNLGLSAAIEWQLQEFEQRTGIHCNLHQNDLGTLHADLNTTLFRIFQETLTNVARHAQASKVDVRLQRENNQITLAISDNGVGIDVMALKDVQSLGLLGMTERIQAWNGNIRFDGAPSSGTTVTITVPIPPPQITAE